MLRRKQAPGDICLQNEGREKFGGLPSTFFSRLSYWRTHFAEAFDRLTQPPGYTFEDLGKITAPTLILTGDRDEFCSVEEGVACYRMLEQGELAVVPNHGHFISPSAVEISIEFLERHLLASQPSVPTPD